MQLVFGVKWNSCVWIADYGWKQFNVNDPSSYGRHLSRNQKKAWNFKASTGLEPWPLWCRSGAFPVELSGSLKAGRFVGPFEVSLTQWNCHLTNITLATDHPSSINTGRTVWRSIGLSSMLSVNKLGQLTIKCDQKAWYQSGQYCWQFSKWR